MFGFIKNIFKKDKRIQELGGTIEFHKMSSKRADLLIEKKEKLEPSKNRKIKGKKRNYGKTNNKNKKFYDKN